MTYRNRRPAQIPTCNGYTTDSAPEAQLAVHSRQDGMRCQTSESRQHGSRTSPMARANREAFRAARERAQKTREVFNISHQVRDELRTLQDRAQDSQVGQGPLVPVVAEMEVEGEEWVYQSVDEDTLEELSHRVVLKTNAGERRELFCTRTLDEAVSAASRIVEFSDGVVLIETFDP